MTQSFLNITTHNVAWLQKRYIANELQLKPPFQRNPVWSPKQKSYLIDTILRGYPIPELYIQEFTDSDGNDVYKVVDGQQRLRACIEFLSGKFTLDAKDTPEWADMSFEDLSDSDKKKVYNYTFVVRVLPEIPDPELRAMFQRLNRNVVALNPQELRHATYWGEFITTMEKLAEDERWSSIGVFTSNDIRRMLDIEFISELVIGYLHGPQNKKDELDDWYQAYEEEFEEKIDVETMINSVLGEIHSCLSAIQQTRWKKKSDFYTLFLTFAAFSDELPFSKDARNKLGSSLVKFGEKVDVFLRDPNAAGISKSAKRYSAAVERAASDLGNRRTRSEEVHKIFKRAMH